MIYAVICEFNPFHNGHRYLLEQLPKGSRDYTICIMSSSFVQRGEPSAYNKWSRAAAAAQFGADLVLELPLPYVLADSDRFASAGAALADALGLPVTLAFGTESTDIVPLAKLAETDEAVIEPILRAGLQAGLSYGAARQQALEQLFPEESALLKSPNNLLAYSYIRACRPREIPFINVPRTAPHDGEPTDGFASASYIRANPDCFDRFCPVPQGPALDQSTAERGILSLLKIRTPAEIAASANISEGLENRICAALSETDSLTALYDRVKTKRYAHAKLRRGILCAALGVSAGLPDAPPPYLRVLAFNERGRGLLKKLSTSAKLPLVQSGRGCEQANAAFFEVERRATDLWNCWSTSPAPSGMDYRKGAIYVSD